MKPMLRLAFGIGAVPLLVLSLLMLTHEVRPLPGMAGCAAIMLASLAIAWGWRARLALLAVSLGEALAQVRVAPARAEAAPLPSTNDLADGIRRLARGLAEQGALLERLRRADAAILENLPEPVLLLSAERAVLRANPAARAMLGPEAAGQGPDSAALLRHPVLAAAMDDALTLGHSVTAELHLPVPVPREVSARVVPLDPPLADGGRLLILLIDRSREAAIERTRADFVANVSHELRTPLAAVAGFIETLLGPARDDPPARDRFLRIMDTEARRMTRLLADLLSLSRIEASEHAAPTDIVALAPILRRVVEALEPGAAAKGIRIALDLPADLPAVIGDADQLQQVAQNLVDNAIKYGRADTRVELAARVGLRKADHAAQVEFSVRDQGEGIAAPHLARLTERFYRVDAGRSRRLGGTGLGLAIVKHIVNRHRGQLTIASVVGQGSVFTVHLPAAGQR